MQQAHDEHYKRAITELGDTRNVVSHHDIYSESGIKLVAAGVQITSELYENLFKHHLLLPLDMCLSTESMLDASMLLDDICALISANPKLEKVANVIDTHSSYRQVVLDIQLPPPLAFKLTVARDKFQKIYRHSLNLVLISTYLAACDGMSRKQLEEVALAALCHDLGLLHIDPSLLDPSHVMSTKERRHLYAHPMISYLMLSKLPGLPKSVGDAVLEHHEHMDGSGYPRGLMGNKIGRYGQILAVGELAAKAFDSESSAGAWRKMEVMLKLNSRQYGPGLIGHLDVFWGDPVDVTTSQTLDMERLTTQVRLIAKMFGSFNEKIAGAEHSESLDYAQSRVSDLKMGLFGAGFDPRDPAGMIKWFRDDPECMHEFAPLLQETFWQFKSLVQEISRRWPEDMQSDNNLSRQKKYFWLDELKQQMDEANLAI